LNSPLSSTPALTVQLSGVALWPSWPRMVTSRLPGKASPNVHEEKAPTPVPVALSDAAEKPPEPTV